MNCAVCAGPSCNKCHKFDDGTFMGEIFAMKTCMQCMNLVPKAEPVCPYCGFEFPLPGRPGRVARK